MQNIFEQHLKELDYERIGREVESIKDASGQYITTDYLKKIFGLLDLTSLNTGDNEETTIEICRKVNEFSLHFNDVPPVAAICIWPSLVHVARKYLNVGGVSIASVAGGFPSSQTFEQVKIMEVRMSVEAGAGEIDVVMPAGRFLAGDFAGAAGEIVELKRAAGSAHLKVILETGLLENMTDIRNASLLALYSGADFIKTSTGKLSPAATYNAVYVMADAVRDYWRRTGRKVGIKPAGGIAEPFDAVVYSRVVASILGEEWVNRHLFRIGASRLANNILSAFLETGHGKTNEVNYF
ncbi:MAG: deoxyribose-phosphate aldolase [Marinilabiliales bacterium]|nr:MAG: deoxyribose-phosphate aldolase [Marinilabiliales bacterium]